MTARFWTRHTFMQHVLRPTRKRAVIDRAYNLSHLQSHV